MHQPTISDFQKPPSGYEIDVTKEDLLNDLYRVERILDQKPSVHSYEKYGRYSKSLYRDRFGCWSEFLKEAGFESAPSDGGPREYSDEELLQMIEDTAEAVGESPSRTQFEEHSEASKGLVCSRFDSWNAAKEKVGLETVDIGGERLSYGELIDEMIDVAVEVGRPPYKRDMRSIGEYSADTYQRRFGSWAEAHRMCGLPERRVGKLPGQTKSTGDLHYGSNWKRMRAKAVERDRYRCQSCGDSINELRSEEMSGLHVHHIVPIRQFEEPEDANFLENLITLCPSCHSDVEGSMPQVDPETLSGR